MADPVKATYTNHYRHCGTEWSDSWDCACNDRCPICNKEIEPYHSVVDETIGDTESRSEEGEPVKRSASIGDAVVVLNPRELALVLAGLRHLQGCRTRNKAYPADVHVILEAAGAENATLLEIDLLAVKLNT